MYFRGYQHAHWVCLSPKSSFAQDGQESQKRKHWGREWSKTNMAAFHSSLHAPSPLVSNAAESDTLSKDELPLDEDIPLAGHKEQDEEEDEEAIGGFLGRN